MDVDRVPGVVDAHDPQLQRDARGRARRVRCLRALVAATVVVACIPVHAAGWVRLLSRTAAEQFQEDDLQMFLEAGRNALNAQGPPKTVEWSNPKNHTGGSFLVVGESTRSGLPCRRIKFATYAPGYPNPPKAWTTWTLCKVDDRWKVADAR